MLKRLIISKHNRKLGRGKQFRVDLDIHSDKATILNYIFSTIFMYHDAV